MTDLRERFRSADELPVGDLWPDVRARVDGQHLAPVRMLPSTRRAASLRRLLTIAAALAIGLAAQAFLWPNGGDRSQPADGGQLWKPVDLRGWIAFSSHGDIHVVRLSPDGSAERERILFHPSVGAAWPMTWSPDGSSLLFSWATPGDDTSAHRQALYLLGDDGTVHQLTTGDTYPEVASFEPGGTILFGQTMPGSAIERLDPTTGDRTLIVGGGPDWPAWPAAAPDGTIAFLQVTSEGMRSIVTTRPDGSRPEVLVDDGLPRTFDASGLAWSPDGDRIVFGLWTEGHLEKIYVVNADGSGLHHVIDGAFPSWSPDGTRLALWRNGELLTVGADGRDPLPTGIRPAGSGWAGRVGPWNASTG